jgi:hypothetical protein
MKRKPSLTKPIDLINFKDHYWLKKELANFCKENQLSAAGSKQEIEECIERFIRTGKQTVRELNKPIGSRDSEKSLTRKTPVINYKSDAATRQFFVKHIGKRFHFNAYLRQFTDKKNITENLTYGDLVDGWLKEESRKN